MTNPYEFDFNGLNIIIYAENKEKAQMIFNQKISEHNERIKTEALAKISERLSKDITHIYENCPSNCEELYNRIRRLLKARI